MFMRMRIRTKSHKYPDQHSSLDKFRFELKKSSLHRSQIKSPLNVSTLPSSMVSSTKTLMKNLLCAGHEFFTSILVPHILISLSLKPLFLAQNVCVY